MSKNEIPKQDPKQKKGLTNALKYFFGVGDAGFVLMSNIETFYFMTFLTDLAGFAAGVAGVINSVFTIVDACLSWLYGGIINGTKAKKWGRYRSWLIMVPWMVPFLYAFMFIRVSDNEWLSAVVIIAASIASHVAWNFSYVANATLISIVGKTPEDKATLASSRATWNNIGGLLFSYMGLPFATLLAGYVGEKNKFAAAAFCLGILMVVTYFAHFKMTEGYEEIETETAGKKNDKTKITIREMFASLFQNPPLMVPDAGRPCKMVCEICNSSICYLLFQGCNGKSGTDDHLSSLRCHRCHHRSFFHEIHCKSNIVPYNYDHRLCRNGSITVPCIYFLWKCNDSDRSYDTCPVLLWYGFCSFTCTLCGHCSVCNMEERKRCIRMDHGITESSAEDCRILKRNDPQRLSCGGRLEIWSCS